MKGGRQKYENNGAAVFVGSFLTVLTFVLLANCDGIN